MDTKTATISIRPIEPSDAEPLYQMVLAQGHDLDAFAWRSKITSLQAEASFIEWANGAETHKQAYSRAILIDGALAGCTSLYTPHPGAFEAKEFQASISMQMGYWVDKECRGAGASWKAMALLMRDIAAGHPSDALAGIRTRSKNFASLSCGAKLGLIEIASGLPSLFDSAGTDIVLAGPLCGPLAPKRGPRPD